MARKYTSTAIATTLSASLGDGLSDTIMYVPNAAAATFPQAYPYTLVVDVDTASEEIVTVTSSMDGTLTVERGQDGTERQAHDAGAVVRHMITPRDLREPQDHIDLTANVHGVSGSVVGTSGEQALTQKTISGATNTFTAIPQSAVTNLVSNLADKASTASLMAHEADTTSVHGIADTSLLATKAYADNAATTVGSTASGALAAHEADTTSIHGITDTSKIATIVSASVGRKLSVQATAPTSPAVGDIWFQVTGL
jgi:hypothetical protein